MEREKLRFPFLLPISRRTINSSVFNDYQFCSSNVVIFYLFLESMKSMISTLLVLHCFLAGCSSENVPVETGADQMGEWLPLIYGKKLALVANHTSLVGDVHLVDTLFSLGKRVTMLYNVFVPEHGFRGNVDAGLEVENGYDPETGIPVISLYGNHKKPSPEDMNGLDLVIFDLQDVGTRFYTYISTLHYVMEACAENNMPLMVLDRPNPNSGYVDGPVMEPEYTSFVGMHPIPVVYGLTIGELAQMINGEGWLKDGRKCELTVIPCSNYYRGKPFTLAVNPSPNLTSYHALQMYPSTCFFEGTVISEGRGTPSPFELYGHPRMEGTFSFTPVSIPGKSTHPKFQDQLCFGEDLRNFVPPDGWTRIRLQWLLDAYEKFPEKEEFFLPYFEKLAGTGDLRKQIIAGWNETRIRDSWSKKLEDYRSMREKYLIYH